MTAGRIKHLTGHVFENPDIEKKETNNVGNFIDTTISTHNDYKMYK